MSGQINVWSNLRLAGLIQVVLMVLIKSIFVNRDCCSVHINIRTDKRSAYILRITPNDHLEFVWFLMSSWKSNS